MTSYIDIVYRNSRGSTAEEVEATIKRLMPELLTDLEHELTINGYPHFDADECDIRTFTSSGPQNGTGLELILYAPMTPNPDDQYAKAETAVRRKLSNAPLRLREDAIEVTVL